MVSPAASYAQVTGPSDVGRIDRRMQDTKIPEAPVAQETYRSDVRMPAAPPGSEKIYLVLQGITLDGLERFDDATMRSYYAEFVGKEITLDILWLIAARMTEHYQRSGYFLSRVVVPLQEISGGQVRFKVIEGYIGEVELDAAAKKNSLVAGWTQSLVGKKPISHTELERLLLRLNQLAGANYRAVLELPTDPKAPEGASKLSLVTIPEKPLARFSYDNFGSKYLGPFEMSQSLSLALLPNQKTSLTMLASTQISELKYLNLAQEIPISQDWTLDAGVSLTAANPGDTLAVQEIESTSRTYSMGATYQWLIGRDQNLSLRAGVQRRDVRSKLLGSIPLARDSVRSVVGSVNYQVSDGWRGYNLANVNLTQGVDGWGASKAGATNLSRAEAVPDFTRIDGSFTRIQALPLDLQLMGSVSGQLASDPLYSSEEFGYGGQSFGRAYDNSEITGDDGVAAAIELRFLGLPVRYDTMVTPYGFYDIGKVWNQDQGAKPASGSSAGAGVRVNHASGVYGNVGFATPLTRPIATPIYGDNTSSRVMMQVGVDF